MDEVKISDQKDYNEVEFNKSPLKKKRGNLGNKRGATKKEKNDKQQLPLIKRPPGHPKTILDCDQLYKLAESMLPVESIAKILDCSPEVIYQNSEYALILQKAREGRKQSLSMAMWTKALCEKDTKMMIWLSKQHLGYKDVVVQEGGQMIMNVNIVEVPK